MEWGGQETEVGGRVLSQGLENKPKNQKEGAEHPHKAGLLSATLQLLVLAS